MMASAAMGKQTIAPPTRRPEPKIRIHGVIDDIGRSKYRHSNTINGGHRQ